MSERARPRARPSAAPAPAALLLASIAALSARAQQPPAAPQSPAPEQPAPPEEEISKWIDPEDGWFDVSAFLLEAHGFLPLVVPITEPALGYGAVAGAVFLDPREHAGAAGWSRPNMTFAGGLWTEDGSDGLFAANSTLWGDGDVQTLVGGGSLGLELALHGIGDDSALGASPLDYRLDVDAGLGEVRKRFGASPWWFGLRFVYARARVDFDGSAAGIPGVDPDDDDVTLAGPALSLRYDSLDNMLTPTRGLLSDTVFSAFGEIFGGTRDFQLFQEVLIGHWPLAERWFLGARGQLDASFGDVPFFARPYVNLRGVPALRYQGEEALSTELELRWQFHERIGAVGFGGAGLAWNDFDDFQSEQSAHCVGLGARYVIARKFGLHMGLDVALGPEEGAIYVQFGNAWLRP